MRQILTAPFIEGRLASLLIKLKPFGSVAAQQHGDEGQHQGDGKRNLYHA